VGVVPDDRLRLIFTCCHPALAVPSRVALTLRLLGGLSTAEIARAFLVPEPTMAQRLVRAKAKIRATGIPYRVPAEADLPDRLPPVLTVVYLVFNEGYAASSGDELVRADLCAVADQDRGRWDAGLIDEGQALVRRCLRRDRPGPYQIQAAINAVHSAALTAADTDWAQIVTLYGQLMAVAPSPVVALNRAVAVAEVDGPAPALAQVDSLALDGYHVWHAVRADLLRRLGRTDEAAVAYREAAQHTENRAERRFLLSRAADGVIPW
jgi:RNA polymerase sigma-70 factor (ECF subfamily)